MKLFVHVVFRGAQTFLIIGFIDLARSPPHTQTVWSCDRCSYRVLTLFPLADEWSALIPLRGDSWICSVIPSRFGAASFLSATFSAAFQRIEWCQFPFLSVFLLLSRVRYWRWSPIWQLSSFLKEKLFQSFHLSITAPPRPGQEIIVRIFSLPWSGRALLHEKRDERRRRRKGEVRLE